jgi:7-carboxy-7-deazaguanine synthase
MKCRVCEIHPCILGESLAAGLAATLVRLSGCNLSCRYCDTRFAAEESGFEVEAEELAARATGWRLLPGGWREEGVGQGPRPGLATRPGLRTVLLTGGEPMVQKEAVVELTGRLTGQGLAVLVETNGSLPLADLGSRICKIVDVKTPGSGHPDSFDRSNLECLHPQDQLKFVLCGREDYDWATDFLAANAPGLAPGNILLSPAWGELDPKELAEWLLVERRPWRLHLQLHKAIWGQERGR